MKFMPGQTIYLTAYFEDSDNDPLTGEAANITFSARYTDDSAAPFTAQAATNELGGGWYNYSYTAGTTAKNFIWWAEHTTEKGFPGGLAEAILIAYTNATHSHSAGTTEQVVFSSSNLNKRAFRGIRLDMNGLANETTVRIKEIIDHGTSNYRVIDSLVWDATMDPGVAIGDIYTNNYIRVTLQSSTAESGAVNVPYTYVLETY